MATLPTLFCSIFDPTQVPGLLAWWDAVYGVTKDGSDKVSAWASRMGSYVAVQATGANQPTWVDNPNGIGVEPAVSFDPTNPQYLTCDALVSKLIATPPAQDAPYTMFVVYDRTDESALHVLWACGNSGNNTPFHWSYCHTNPFAATYRRDDGSGEVFRGAVGGGTGSRIRCDVCHGTMLDLYEGGGTPLIDGGAFDVGVTTVDRFTIGALGKIGYSNGFKGHMAHLLFYDNPLTAASINLIGDYLSSRSSQGWTDVS